MPYDQKGCIGIAQHAFGYRTKQHVLQAVAAVSVHDDEFGVFFVGHTNNGFCRGAFFHAAANLLTRCIRIGHNGIEQGLPLGLLFCKQFGMCLAAHNLRQGLKNVQQYNFSAGESAGMGQGRLGAGQPILAAYGDKNCLVHGVPYVACYCQRR